MPDQPSGMMSQPLNGQLPPQPSPEGQTPSQPSLGGYNGTVVLQGESFEAEGGIIVDDSGDKLYISDDGSMVTDDEGDIIGYVKEGEIVPLDDAHVEMLKQRGVIHNEHIKQ